MKYLFFLLLIVGCEEPKKDIVCNKGCVREDYSGYGPACDLRVMTTTDNAIKNVYESVYFKSCLDRCLKKRFDKIKYNDVTKQCFCITEYNETEMK